MKKVWKKIPGFSSYSVSELGEIKRNRDNKKIKYRTHKSGYFHLGLQSDTGERKFCLVHRIVCLSFNGRPPKGKNHVNHIDGVKKNNLFRNLEWCSPKENTRHAWKIGLYEKMRSGMMGARGRRAVLTEKKVILILKMRDRGHSYTDISKKFKVCSKTAERICTGKSWKYLPEVRERAV